MTNKPEAYVVERAEKVGISACRVSNRKILIRKMRYEEAILSCIPTIRGGMDCPRGLYASVGRRLLLAYPQYREYSSFFSSIFSWKRCDWTSDCTWCESDGRYGSLVDAGMDTGPILAQRAVDVVDGDVEKDCRSDPYG